MTQREIIPMIGDMGMVVHAVPDGKEYCVEPALCGISPHRWSVGWLISQYKKDVNCKRCLKSLKKLLTNNK